MLESNFSLKILLSELEEMLSLSTHILDTTKGKPAENVTVKLFKYVDYTWMESNTIGRTDDNGRIREFSKIDEEIFGTYKLRFEVDEYFKRQHIVDALYPYIEVN